MTHCTLKKLTQTKLEGALQTKREIRGNISQRAKISSLNWFIELKNNEKNGPNKKNSFFWRALVGPTGLPNGMHFTQDDLKIPSLYSSPNHHNI